MNVPVCVQALRKKHEAFELDLSAHGTRLDQLKEIADELGSATITVSTATTSTSTSTTTTSTAFHFTFTSTSTSFQYFQFVLYSTRVQCPPLLSCSVSFPDNANILVPHECSREVHEIRVPRDMRIAPVLSGSRSR